ncbi:hypothetical protein BIV57_09485 [Mangrovactinospora gilvigrisea]|uniref:Methyltransferase type 11 domain-containing protein n=1 Tax=Mangrovactinospora gilvigrisea TaxID=1428644 RepID=A0A1J7BGM1_9ACTN|nr:hypothetical protein BIV57_09485 [Mangrovactinospora gilvigrisea]
MRPATACHRAHDGEFAAPAPDAPDTAGTDRRAILELAGAVRGRRILDLGCGPGRCAEELLRRGAALVVGAEGSEARLEQARERLGGWLAGGREAPARKGGGGRRAGTSAELHLHDLEEPLVFAGDASFDTAVMALAYHRVRDRAALLAEVRRVLRPGGVLLLSTAHPGAGAARPLTLEALFGELLGAGFVLEELREPRAAEEDDRELLALRLRRP